MTATKLSDSQKQEIIELYRETEENTVTLAERYGVSSSTVRRILQGAVPVDEYKALVQQKQKRSHSQQHKSHSASREDRNIEVDGDFDKKDVPTSTSPTKKTRKLSSSVFESETDPTSTDEENEAVAEENYALPKRNFEKILGEELLDGPSDLDEFDEEDEEDEEDAEDEEDFAEDELEEDEELETDYTLGVQPYSQTQVQVLPLSEAVIPKICYLVVDRSTELVTPPLMDFGELGQIPAEESLEKTLPVFDNHRVAKRFSARNQRVLKVPDGRMLKQTSSYLQAKGISRLLIDGQVYRF
ncbi:MAG: transcriptional regulator [Cyanobacteriota bacterium]|nr:transcriptional regulator [Cyanobacteriota bacterium]